MSKRKRPSIQPKEETKELALEQEKIIQKLQEEKKPVSKKKKIRFTMDLPAELHEKIKTKSAKQGQMMKGYFVALALNDLDE